ncbi:hypothetical protein ACHQM5_015702 [Ranunculus cassubicifolius]
MFICDTEETVLGTQAATGSCPYCGGKVRAMDVESAWRFCFLPLCFSIRRKFYCTLCCRKLVINC